MLHIVPEAVEVPGVCAITQSTTGPFLDTQVTVPRHGRIYLSVPWLNSVAADLGWVPAPELHDALEDLDAALEATGALAARVERFDEDVTNVADALSSFAREIKSRDALLAELATAREVIASLDARVTELEATDAP